MIFFRVSSIAPFTFTLDNPLHCTRCTVQQVSDDDVENGYGYGRGSSSRTAASLPQTGDSSSSNSSNNGDFRPPYTSYFEPSERELEQFFSREYSGSYCSCRHRTVR